MGVGILEVLLVDARELKERNICCVIDCLLPFLNESKAPYAKIQYGAQNQTSCLAQGEGKKEIWNEKFRFQVEYQEKRVEEEEEADDMKHKVVLSIIDKHLFSTDFLVGETTIYIKDVILRGMAEGKVVHGPHKYRVIRPDKSYSGQVSVAVTFIKANDGNEVDFRSGEQSKLSNEETCDR